MKVSSKSMCKKKIMSDNFYLSIVKHYHFDSLKVKQIHFEVSIG